VANRRCAIFHKQKCGFVIRETRLNTPFDGRAARRGQERGVELAAFGHETVPIPGGGRASCCRGRGGYATSGGGDPVSCAFSRRLPRASRTAWAENRLSQIYSRKFKKATCAG